MQNRVLCVIGKKGSGKSTLVGEIIAERAHNAGRVIIIDSMAEYDQGVTAYVDGALEDAGDRLIEATRARRYCVAVRALAVEDNLDMIELSYAIAGEQKPGMLLVIEETSLYVSPASMPDEIAQLVRYGRHRGLDLLFVARRPSELHRDLTANCDVLVTFATQEPRDILYLRSFYGDEAFALNALPDYHVKVFGDLSRAPSAVLHRLAQQGD